MPPRGVLAVHGKRLVVASAMLVALSATAQLAGADEFIQELPQRYDTMI